MYKIAEYGKATNKIKAVQRKGEDMVYRSVLECNKVIKDLIARDKAMGIYNPAAFVYVVIITEDTK